MQSYYTNNTLASFSRKLIQHANSYITQSHNPWIWRENQRGALIGFSYSEIRFLNKNSKMSKSKRYFLPEYLFFPAIVLFFSITYDTNLHFCELCMLSSIKCTSDNTKYKQVFRAMWRYLY